jgi:NADH:ubiquinone reductase (H+-translocating)
MADHIVVVGAGFAGLTAAQRLAGKPVEVTVIDRHDYHLFQPLLYQVVTGELEPQTPAHAVRRILRTADNVGFRMGAVTGVDLEAREVAIDDGHRVRYDHLVLAAGATTNTLGIDGVREHCYPLKTLADAERLRDHVLRRFERAASAAATGRDLGEGALTFVIVGAGPTGVELSGALSDLVHHVLRDDFPELDVAQVRILLVEALPHVLDAFAEDSRTYAEQALRSRGVEVRLDTPLEGVGEGHAVLAGGEKVPAETIVWTAGVRAHPIADTLGVEQAGGERVVVADDLSVPGHPEVFVVGDIAGATGPDGEPYPQLAPVAIQQAEHVVRQIALRRRGSPTEPFAYTDKGIMAKVGRGAAVAEMPGGIHLTGVTAWSVWLAAHLLFLIGFRNRALVVVNWLYSYVALDRAARLIVRGSEPPRRTPGEERDAEAA